MRRRGVGHWQGAALVGTGALALWLGRPGPVWAAAAGGAAAILVVLAARARRPGALVAAVLAVTGAGLAGRTTLRIRAIESRWDEVREVLVSEAGRQLAAELEEAVTAVQALADLGLEVRHRAAPDGVARLERALAGGPERGVTVFDPADRPLAWAGRHRIRPDRDAAGLEAAITAYYAVLFARRQSDDGASAVAQVTLAADSAVPDRGATLAARFLARTGAALRIYPPGRGPGTGDVFDYCVPECGASAADTLFSVRMIPPTQGAHKLAVERQGVRGVTVAAALLLVMLVLAGRPLARGAAVAAAGALLVLTPAGPTLAPGGAFSPATYFQDLLGPFTASAGALTVTAGLGILAGLAAWRIGLGRHPVAALLSAALLVGAPALLRALADGITPPAGGADPALWVGWELALMMATAALLLVAAALLRTPRSLSAPRWMTWLAIGGAVAAAVLGLFVWDPAAGWPAWYAWVWLPPAVLAVQAAPPFRAGAALTVVAGAAAGLLTWEAAAGGRLLLAERDAAGLRQEGDAIAVGLLERFADRVLDAPPPAGAADLYARWSRSPLETDDYPAVLAVWDGDGGLRSRLALADLDVGLDRQRAVARAAAARGEPDLEEVTRVPGTHYILGIPFPDDGVVTVTLGPRSRAIPGVRVARFLRGEALTAAPYEISLSAPVADVALPAGRLTWRRDGWTARGEERLVLPGGVRHVHARVPLGGFGSLAVRGTLVLLLDGVVLAALWLLAAWLAERVRVPDGLERMLSRPSFRVRLGGALAVFFVAPTLAFAGWAGRRLAAEAERSRDLIIGQTLRDAATSVRDLVAFPAPLAAARLEELAERLDAELLVYTDGRLAYSSTPVLEQLGLVDPYLPARAVEELVAGDELETTLDREVAGRPTRIGYRNLGTLSGGTVVLAAPRLVEDADLVRGEEDLAFGLLLATLAGLVAATALATVAARSLSRPVRALRDAAERVGRGETPRPFGADVPSEFLPVMDAFERMARDVAAGRAALEAQRRRTATVLRNVATGVVALDRTLQVRIANPRAEELLGVRLEVGAPVREVTGAAWRAIWDWVLGARRAAPGEEDTRDFPVGEREVRVQRASLGEDGGWVVALDDITELTHAVRVLAWGELARQIAHEIKNPLTPIRLGIQHLRRSYDAPKEDFGGTLEQTSRQMLAEIERLDAIARAFSRFGAPPAGAEPLGSVDLLEVARDAAALYTLGAEATIDVRGDGAVAPARRDELKEVLINLIENARTAGASRITISVRDGRGGGPGLVVQDDGRGIAAEHLPRIFEPRFSTTTSGSGLGLAICRRLVESWGGAIRVESEQGTGTRVVIEFGVQVTGEPPGRPDA